MNTGELDYALYLAERRVLEIQAKLHRWAGDDPHRRFDDLYNLVTDPAFLLVAWVRVRGNKGARTAGVDGETARYVEATRGVEGFVAELRDDLKARAFLPVAGPAASDPQGWRQGPLPGNRDHPGPGRPSLPETSAGPIFEADFLGCSYGSCRTAGHMTRWPRRTTSTSCSYEWVVEATSSWSIQPASAVMDRARMRIKDKRVLALVQAFAKAGTPTEDGMLRTPAPGPASGAMFS